MITGSENRYLDDHVGNFIDALEIRQDEASVKLALKRFAMNTGFSRFVYADLYAEDVRSFSDYPEEWQRRYLARNYVSLDPILTKAKRTMAPTVWSIADRDRYNAEQCRVMDEASEFGISSGIMVPIRSGFGRTALLAFASECPDAANVRVRDLAYAVTAVAYVHINLLRLSNSVMEVAEISLSPREHTCLVWASLGKTMAETSSMVGISEKTVRYYLDRAREKLGATNIVHAVRLAAERGWL